MPPQTKTILIVRPGALGDTILALPLLVSIRSEYPAAQITYLGNSSYRDLLPSGTEFQSIDSPRWLWLFGSRGHPGNARTFNRAYVILNQSDDLARNLLNAGTERVLTAASSPPPGKHVVEHLHEALSFRIPQKLSALTLLAPRKKRDVIWIHPGSGGPKKCVPLEFITRLAEIFRTETRSDLIVTAGEADGFLKGVPLWERLIRGPRTHLIDNRPIIELCSELGGARLFVGNDSGVSHLAAGLGVPSAVFFIASDPIQWAPWVSSERLKIIDCRGEGAFGSGLESEARSILDLAGL